MARRRYLQPGYWTNPLLSKCPPLTRLLFQVVWTHSDYDGCFLWDSEDLAMKGLPRDNFDAGEALDRLEQDGFVKSYMVGEKRYGYVVNWHKHQDPHPGEKPVYPKPIGDPGFVVKVKDAKWRKKGDTAFEAPELPSGLFPWVQVAGNLQAGSVEVADTLSATDKEGQEGKESLYQEKPVHRVEPVLPPPAEKQRKTRKLIIQGHNKDVRWVVNTLWDEWHTEDPVDGRVIRVEPGPFCGRVAEILKEHPEITPYHLVMAGREFLAAKRDRYSAPQYFFGPGRDSKTPLWLDYVQLILTTRARRDAVDTLRLARLEEERQEEEAARLKAEEAS